MDARSDAHYTARTHMNVLLLLSALLSAITGVNVGSARAPVAAEQVVRASQVVAAVAVFPATTERPAQAIGRLTSRLTAITLVRLPVLAIPAFASRRRE